MFPATIFSFLSKNGTGGLAYGAVAVANLPHKDVDTVVHREGHGAGLFVYEKLLVTNDE